MIDGRISSEVNKNYAVSLADSGVYSGTTSIKTTLNNTIAQNNTHQTVVEEMDLDLSEETLSIEEIATEIIKGDWGNGEERKRKLEEAGYNYEEVQGKVNEILIGYNTYEGQENNSSKNGETSNFEPIKGPRGTKIDLPKQQDDKKKESGDFERVKFEEKDYNTIENPSEKETQTFVNSIDVNISGNQDVAYTKFDY